MTVRKLRIAMLSVHSCPVGTLGAKDTGGMSVHIRELAGKLGKQGHTVDIYTRVHDPKDPQIVNLGQNARLIHLRAGDEEIDKLAVYTCLPDFVENLESFRENDSLQYDLLYSHYWISSLAGKHLQQRWNIPHITTFHTLGAVKNAIGIGEKEPDLRIESEKEAVRDCQHIIATTEKEKTSLIHYYGASPENISVVPCGVNMELFRPVDKEDARRELGSTDDKIILFVGRIEPLKGIATLLRAMPYLQDGHRPRLVIIGGDKRSQPEIEKLQGLCRELQIEDSVTFLGMIKQDKLPYFYSAAEVCVIPSYYESFGLVALESLACGTPVVATDVGNLKDIIQPGVTGYVVTENTPHSLAEKIDRILCNPQPHTESALSIRASVHGFSWTNIAEAINRECQLAVDNYLIPVL
ncbi:MAG: glycosyltransferase [Dehalococcoidales bacterium]|nr:glycosyltransferase [Dehalococcoidales bacterium]